MAVMSSESPSYSQNDSVLLKSKKCNVISQLLGPKGEKQYGPGSHVFCLLSLLWHRLVIQALRRLLLAGRLGARATSAT